MMHRFLCGLLLLLSSSCIEGSIGSFRPWGTLAPKTTGPASLVLKSNKEIGHYYSSPQKQQHQKHKSHCEEWSKPRTIEEALSRRGGYEDEPSVDVLGRWVGTATQLLISLGRTVLPPIVATVKGVANFYRALPTDAIVAQIGLVYCFAGGYYPTLFSSLQAAQHCGWHVMVEAIEDLTEEAIRVIDATAELSSDPLESRKDIFLHQTNIVLKTVDPMKINQAAAALYTTWLGVSAVLEKEYVRVISLSMTLAGYLERITHFILEPPVKMFVQKEYHRWVPVVIGWGCKATAMNFAWRIQRVLTASTSAIFGGFMFARAVLRMLSKRGIRFFGLIRQDKEESSLDEIIGFLVAALGFYTQIAVQYKNSFSFQVPFPVNLVTWPFDWAEQVS